MASTKAIAAIALTLIIAVPIGLGYVLAFNEEETVNWETTDQFNVSDYLLNHSTPYMTAYSGPSNNTELIEGGSAIAPGYTVAPKYVSTSSTVSSTQLYHVGTVRIQLNPGDWTPIVTSYETYTISLSTNSFIRFSLAGGSTYTMSITSPVYANVLRDGHVWVGEEHITNVTGISVKFPSDVENLRLSVKTYYDQYADVSAGWKVSDDTINAGSFWRWFNTYSNSSVTMLVNLGDSSDFTLQPDSAAHSVHIKRDAGLTTVNDQPLGAYSSIQILMDSSGYTVTGITAWPTMGQPATPLNSITVGEVIPPFTFVTITPTGDGSEIYRVDSAQIVAGSFPTTKDYTLSLSDLFPDSLMSLKLNSIGVYGDSLTVGGVELPVTDGKVHVDGKNVSLKGAVISFLPDEEGWLSCYINGRDLGIHFAALPSVTFGGEWSLTAIAFKVEQVAGTSVEWHAGDFGLDQGGIIAAGLLTCIGAFVFLGMYGKASGTKIGLLAVVCGGAAIVLFMMI